MSEERIREELLKAHDEKRLVSCRIPYGGDITITLEKHLVDQSMDGWRNKPALVRKIAMKSILRTIKRTVKRIKQGEASEEEMDELAADIALWLGHELVFTDGEKYLIKGPSRDALQKETDTIEKVNMLTTKGK